VDPAVEAQRGGVIQRRRTQVDGVAAEAVHLAEHLHERIAWFVDAALGQWRVYLESVSMALEARFDGDRFVAMMPMFHTAQFNCHCTAAVMVGATIYIQRGLDAASLLA
jgi:hypothetical protein